MAAASLEGVLLYAPRKFVNSWLLLVGYSFPFLYSKVCKETSLLYHKSYRNVNIEAKTTICGICSPLSRPRSPCFWYYLIKDIKSLRLFSSFLVEYIPKTWMLAIVTCCVPWTCVTLHYVRKRLLKVCYLYNIVHWLVDFPDAPLLYKPCNNYSTGYTHPLLLVQTQTRTACWTLHVFYFFSHAVVIWDSLPCTYYYFVTQYYMFMRTFVIYSCCW